MHRNYLAEETSDPLESDSEVEFHLSSLLQSEYSAVLFLSDGKSVGYALYSVHPRYVYIRAFYVRKRFRGKGYGEQAVRRLRNDLWQNVASIQVDVHESDTAALDFWEDLGFRTRTVRMELETAKKSSIRKSCGAIIYRRTLGGLRYLVLEHVDGDHWGFPKGHGRGNETEEETALREIREETGLDVRFRRGFYERSHYLTPKSRKKEVVCFLARVRTRRVSIQPEEIKSYRWANYNDARELLTFANTRVLLDKAHEYITDRGAKPY